MPVVQIACDKVGIPRSTAYRNRVTDRAFADAWDDATESGIDRAEAECFRRGVAGWSEPVIDRGRLAYQYERKIDPEGKESFVQVLDERGQPVPLTVRKHSDLMLTLILKGRRKKVYADRTELTGADGAPVAIDETTRTARVAQLLAIASKRKDLGEEFASESNNDEFGDLA